MKYKENYFMKKSNIFTTVTSIALASATISNVEAAPSWAKKGDTIVKCKGIVKKGQNDCGANGHSCHYQAKKIVTQTNGYTYRRESAKKS